MSGAIFQPERMRQRKLQNVTILQKGPKGGVTAEAARLAHCVIEHLSIAAPLECLLQAKSRAESRAKHRGVSATVVRPGARNAHCIIVGTDAVLCIGGDQESKRAAESEECVNQTFHFDSFQAEIGPGVFLSARSTWPCETISRLLEWRGNRNQRTV
jgi:hypothetical protein